MRLWVLLVYPQSSVRFTVQPRNMGTNTTSRHLYLSKPLPRSTIGGEHRNFQSSLPYLVESERGKFSKIRFSIFWTVLMMRRKGTLCEIPIQPDAHNYTVNDEFTPAMTTETCCLPYQCANRFGGANGVSLVSATYCCRCCGSAQPDRRSR